MFVVIHKGSLVTGGHIGGMDTCAGYNGIWKDKTTNELLCIKSWTDNNHQCNKILLKYISFLIVYRISKGFRIYRYFVKLECII